MKQITSLRGLAIILIILFHLNPEHFPYGYFGVEVFLVISGYLLMKSLQKQQMQIRLGEFARKKVLRLFTPVAVIVPLKHGEVGDKAQVEPILVDQIQATT